MLPIALPVTLDIILHELTSRSQKAVLRLLFPLSQGFKSHQFRAKILHHLL